MSELRTTFAKIGQFAGLASMLVLLSISQQALAQELNSQASTTSVDETFSVLRQELSATANDLLHSAQRPMVGLRAEADVPSTSGPVGGWVFLTEKQAASPFGVPQSLQRVQALRPVLEPILKEVGVPLQMTAVVLVESGGQSNALSPKGARGLWQFMPDTARRYGLTVTASLDERLDPYKSTRAAARYLRDLYAQFGNWPLALAAYNVGEDTVQRAVERFGTREFSAVARAGALPLETRNYVPAVLRAMEILREASTKEIKTRAGGPTSDLVAYAVATREN